jgi:hypothetical protein
MAWERLAHTAWNNSTPDDMEIEFAKRQNIKVITYIVASGNVNAKWILNDSTGNPYTNKYGDNGANMSADTSDSAMDYDIGTVTGASYNVHTIHNVDGREKLYIGQQMTTSSGDGSGTVPKRREWAGKFTTTSGQINKIKVTSDGSGNMASGSYITVYGAKESATADSISINGGEQTLSSPNPNFGNITAQGNWEKTGSGGALTFTNGINQESGGSGNTQMPYLDLQNSSYLGSGNYASETKWVLRWKQTWASSPDNYGTPFMVLSSTTGYQSASQNYIGIRFDGSSITAGGETSSAVDGASSSTGVSTSYTSTTYYMELVRDGSKIYVRNYTSSAYDTIAQESSAISIGSGTYNLRYIKMIPRWDTGSGDYDTTWDEIKFYNNQNNLTLPLSTTKKNYRLEAHLLGANTRVLVTFNDDSSSLYSYRFSANGASDSEGNVGTTSFNPTVATSPDEKYLTMDISNDQTKPKFVNADLVDDAYNRMELTGKYANSTDLIDKIKITNNDSNGSFAEGSEMILWGSDGAADTTQPTIVNGFILEETDTGKHYIWNATTSTWTEIA